MDEISLSGTIYKYTNVLFGYQKRYFKLKRGTIYYYLSRDVETEGCRKFRVLKNFKLEFDDDPCRIDLCFPDEQWFLKFDNEEEKKLWQNALESFLSNEKQYHIVQTERRRESIRSLPSDSSGKSHSTKLVRTVTVETQHGNHNSSNTSFSPSDQLDLHKLSNIKNHMPEQFEQIIRILNHVVDTRGAPLDLAIVEQTCYSCKNVIDQLKYLQTTLPQIKVDPADDYLELHENYLSEDEWFEATSEGPFNNDQQIKDSFKPINKMPTQTSDESEQNESHKGIEAPIFSEIRRITGEQLKYALAGVDEGVWELFVKDGEMKMYKMEKEVDGVMCDPLKAVHSVKGVTAREFIDVFFDPKLKMEWDDTLVRATVVDRLSDNIVVLHQLHKRVWPAAQRESLFWSNLLELKKSELDAEAYNGFAVCNQNIDREDVPLTDSSCVRVGLTIAMVCQSVVDKTKPLDKLGRNDVTCKIVYVAQVHPGGWIPTSALRQVYKREYPKFLRSFTSYVQKKMKDKPVNL